MKLYRVLQSQGFGSRKGCLARVRAGAVAPPQFTILKDGQTIGSGSFEYG